MSSRFNFLSTGFDGLKIIHRLPVIDDRGSFTRLFCAEEFQAVGMKKPIVQINRSENRDKGMVRGLHFQYPPDSETKIVSCLKGAVFDVLVDLRAGSKTFLHWCADVLLADDQNAFYIPEGFAHGFQTLEDDCILLYFHTAFYTSAAEGAFNVKDPRLNISWPLPITKMSDRDKVHPFISEDFSGIEV